MRKRIRIALAALLLIIVAVGIYQNLSKSTRRTEIERLERMRDSLLATPDREYIELDETESSNVIAHFNSFFGVDHIYTNRAYYKTLPVTKLRVYRIAMPSEYRVGLAAVYDLPLDTYFLAPASLAMTPSDWTPDETRPMIDPSARYGIRLETTNAPRCEAGAGIVNLNPFPDFNAAYPPAVYLETYNALIKKQRVEIASIDEALAYLEELEALFYGRAIVTNRDTYFDTLDAISFANDLDTKIARLQNKRGEYQSKINARGKKKLEFQERYARIVNERRIQKNSAAYEAEYFSYRDGAAERPLYLHSARIVFDANGALRAWSRTNHFDAAYFFDRPKFSVGY